MSTCFIADLHLSGDEPEVVERFIRFLTEEAVHHQALYILGDLFEVWLGDDLSLPEQTLITEALQQTVAQGTAIYLQHGNRDFLIGDQFTQASGCTLIPDPYRIALNGEAILITHGDQLCSDDLDYQRYRNWIRHPLTTWLLRHLPRPLRRRIGQSLRARSDQDKQQKSMAIMDVTQATVASTLQQWQLQQIIHGHTHRPDIHHFTLNGAPATRMVLGDWSTPSNNVLIYSDGIFMQQGW